MGDKTKPPVRDDDEQQKFRPAQDEPKKPVPLPKDEPNQGPPKPPGGGDPVGPGEKQHK